MKKLLFSVTKKDLEVQTFRCSGPGGQNVNKVSSGVRIIHPASGATGESRAERTQGANKKLAFEHLVKSARFKLWLNKMIFETQQTTTLEERIQEQMKSHNLRFEVVDSEGKWIPDVPNI